MVVGFEPPESVRMRLPSILISVISTWPPADKSWTSMRNTTPALAVPAMPSRHMKNRLVLRFIYPSNATIDSRLLRSQGKITQGPGRRKMTEVSGAVRPELASRPPIDFSHDHRLYQPEDRRKKR